MNDLIFLAVIVGFFAAAFGLLRACERIIGPDPVPTTSSTGPAGTAADSADADRVGVTA